MPEEFHTPTLRDPAVSHQRFATGLNPSMVKPGDFAEIGAAPVRRQIAFFVPSTPIAQGNHRVNPSGRMYDATQGLKQWREAIVLVARNLWVGSPMAGAVAVHAEFYLPKPRTVARELPSVRPDVDKLARAAFDALTLAGIWGDDAQVCDLRARKFYAALDREIGARFWIGEIA